jgi:hypothetical protein
MFVRRISLVSAAIVVALLTTGVAAVSAKAPAKTKQTSTKVTCTLALTAAVPTGDTVVTPGDPQGTQFGFVACHTLFGRGVQTDPYTQTASGDVVGSYKQYFGTGTIHGAYDLSVTAQSAPTTTTFTEASYAGTVTVTGGTGTDAGIKGRGTLICSSPDAIHTTCTEHLKLKLPAGN